MKQIVGYVTQDYSFYDLLTVQENMAYFSALYNVPNKERAERIEHLLEATHLQEMQHLLAKDLSGGQKRRLDFALALVHNPEIVILDEPTTGLDPYLVEEFWKVVTSIVEEKGIAVLVSTHHLHEVMRHCKKIAVLDHGSLQVKKTFTIESLQRLFS